MSKKAPVTNGIFEKDGKTYMMCGDKNVEMIYIKIKYEKSK